jgi:D-arabinose 1-dehydrogenase-like Zn-dependent alcohol dehydrogenase
MGRLDSDASPGLIALAQLMPKTTRERSLVIIDDAKLALARDMGIGGVHGVAITAVLTTAFHQGSGMLRRGGTCVLVGLSPGEFPVPIFPVVLEGLTIR